LDSGLATSPAIAPKMNFHWPRVKQKDAWPGFAPNKVAAVGSLKAPNGK
jgi:hypothetical protein